VDSNKYCPQHFDDNCCCRKPKAKLLLHMADGFDIDLERSLMIENLPMHIQVSEAVNCKTISKEEYNRIEADATVSDLLESENKIFAGGV